jgi:amino acid adenylation domain-containing protein
MDILVSEHAADIEMSFDASRISLGMAENVASTFAQVVRAIVSDSSCLIDNLDLVSPQNMKSIMEWNSRPIDVVDARVDDIISTQVERTPDKEAVVGWDGTFTYRELDDAAERFARSLRDLGVGPGTLVPFCFEKSVWTIVAMLSILKAGGAFVPLDPAYPAERLQNIVQDAEARVIVSSPEHEALSRSLADHVVVISLPVLEQIPTTPQRREAVSGRTTTDAAYVIFTSGSTGNPKGIIIEHRAIATSSKAHGRAMHMDASTRTLQFASYTFDVSVEEILTTLQLGGTVCVPSEQERSEDLSGAIARYGATWADLTPTVASLIDPAAVPSFKTLCLGGEAVRQDVVDTWAGKVELVNGYGPAEASVTCVCSTEDLSGRIESTNIGVGVGCRLWVVDPSNYNKLAPVGTTGELLIDGPILAREYLKDPEKTRASFVTTPAWAPAGTSMRLYRTRDMVRYTSNGTLNFVGRSDMQVKICGQRVELGDIEFNLSSCPEFDQIVVAFPKTGLLSNQLTGVVTLAKPSLAAQTASPLTLEQGVQASASAKAIEWLSDRVPAHM